jgi:hypothetical protein
VQLLAPLLSALAFARPTATAFACAAFALVLLLAHEPLIVLLGRRGANCRAARAPTARVQLFGCGAAAVCLGLTASYSAADVSLALATAVCLSVVALGALLARREKSLAAELLAAAALTSFSLPVLVAQHVPPRQIGVFIGAWLAAQLLATLTARAYVYRRRDGERPLRAASTSALLLLGVAALLAAQGYVPPAAGLALAPFTLVATMLQARTYRPRTPKSVGWALTAASLAAVVLLGATLPHGP